MDGLFEQLEHNQNLDPDFHINFCLLDQGTLNPYALNVTYTMFESDRICQQWVDSAKRLDLIIVPTEFNKKSFAASGIPESKLAVCPIPFDLSTLTQVSNKSLQTYGGESLLKYKHRFLNVSEYIDRKNVHGLIKAWAAETKPEDDACLILKINCNSGSRTDYFKSKIDNLIKDKKCAPIFFIGQFLSDNDVRCLHHMSTHCISASFGEGWGLGETYAGLIGRKLVVPNSSAFTEYLTKDTAYLIETQASAARQDGPTAGFYYGSNWFIPIQFSLRKKIREAIKDANDGNTEKEDKLKVDLRAKVDSFTNSQKLLKIVRNHLYKRSKPASITLNESHNNFNWAMICKSAGQKCGIADYSKSLYQGMCTESNKSLFNGCLLAGGESIDYPNLIESIDAHVVNIQLEYQFISAKRLKYFIQYLQRSNIVPVVTMHTVNPRAYDYNNVLRETGCPIVVSSQRMKDELVNNGFSNTHNIKVIPMGIDQNNIVSNPAHSNEQFRIGFFGFCYFHKGLDKLIQYMRVHGVGKECLILSARPENDSGYFERAKNLLASSPDVNILWNTNYLDDAEVIRQLATCDLIFLPYKEYGGIAVSAAIRNCLKAGVPIVSFNTSFFNDVVFDSGIVKFMGDDPDDFETWSANLNRFIESLKTMGIAHAKERYISFRDKFIEKYNWEHIGQRYLTHFQNLLIDNQNQELGQ